MCARDPCAIVGYDEAHTVHAEPVGNLLFRLAHADVGDALESVRSSSPSMPLVVLTATATHEEV
jgi:hypothetical protein